MVLGLARVSLYLPGAQSLKEKRVVLRRVRDRMRNAHNLAIAEVGAQDIWQRAVLGIAVLGNDERAVGSELDTVIRSIENLAEVTGVEREVTTRSEPMREIGLEYRY